MPFSSSLPGVSFLGMAHEEETIQSKVLPIAASANQCLECFQQCLYSASSIHARELSKVEDQLAEFSTWAAGIGVLAPGRASMDHRLRYAPEVQSVVIGLLESLSYRVRTCTNVLTNYSAEFPSNTERFHKSLGDIALEVSNLNKLSNTIRKAGNEAQILKASEYQIKDDKGNDIEPFLLDLFEHYISDRFPKINQTILKRLASTMLLRRKRILYRRHRQGTNAIRTEEGPTKTRVVLPSAPSKYTQEADETIKAANTPSQIKSATILDPNKFKISSHSPSIISASKTVALSNHEALVFPAAPGFSAKKRYERLKSQDLADRLNGIELDPVVSNENSRSDEVILREIGEITCPYCFYALPAQDVFDEKKWQNHIKNDLDPYVCLFEDCDQPDVLYSHSEGWISHLRGHCKRWYCSSHRELGAFNTREEYMKHMREVHKTKLTATQLRVLAKINTRYTNQIFQVCPLCLTGAADVKGRLEDHISGHLRSLALKSLPIYSDESPHNGESEKGTSEISRPRSRSTTRDLETLIHLPGWGTENFWNNWEEQIIEDHSTNFLGEAHVDLDLTDNQIKISSRTIDELAFHKFPESNKDDLIINSLLQRKKEVIGESASRENTAPNSMPDENVTDLACDPPKNNEISLPSVAREADSSKNIAGDGNELTADDQDQCDPDEGLPRGHPVSDCKEIEDAKDSKQHFPDAPLRIAVLDTGIDISSKTKAPTDELAEIRIKRPLNNTNEYYRGSEGKDDRQNSSASATFNSEARASAQTGRSGLRYGGKPYLVMWKCCQCFNVWNTRTTASCIHDNHIPCIDCTIEKVRVKQG